MASKQGVTIIVAGEDKTGEVFNAVNKHLADTRDRAKDAGSSFSEMGEMVKRGLETAGIAIGLHEIVSQLKEAVTRATEFGEAIEKAQIKTGIAAGTLSVLHYAATVTGGDFEQLVKGAGKLGKNMADAADGNQKLEKAFRSIGVNASDLVGRTDGIDIAFKALGKTLAVTESPAKRNQLLIDLLGKSGMESAPAILQLAEHFDTLKAKTQAAGTYLDQMSAEKLVALNQAMKDLKERVLGASISFTEGMQSALTGVMTAINEYTGKTNLANEAGKQIGLTIIPVAAAFMELATWIREAKDEYVNLRAAVNVAGYSIAAPFSATARDLRDKARQELHDSKTDHDAAIADEKRFIDSMKGLKDQIEHPKEASASEGGPSLSIPRGGAPPAGSSTGTSDKAAQERPDKNKHYGPLRKALQSYYEKEYLKEQAQYKADDEKQLEPSEADVRNFAEWMQTQQAGGIGDTFKSTPFNPPLGEQSQDYTALKNAGEKMAHGIFDPLFDTSQRWDQQWKQIKANLLRDLGQLAEGQLMGMLFGDPEGRGGRGLSGGSWDGNTNKPGARTGLASEALGGLLGMFHHKQASATSNGGVGAGAGTVATAAASLLQTGKANGGGIQVVIQNQGPPMAATATQHMGDGGEGNVIQIMLKQMETNGPIAQAIAALVLA